MTNKEIRQKAIECRKLRMDYCDSHRSKYLVKHLEPCTDCEYYELYAECMIVFAYEHGFSDGIEEGKRLSTAWIPVTERLPEECGKSYIVCLKNGHVDIATSMYDGRLVFICEHCVREPFDTNPIIAWMPLPQPYKEGEKNE